MRTTVVIDSDVAAEIERLRQKGMGLSEALNLLARRGMARESSATTAKYTHRTSRMGLKIDVTNIADVLDLAEPAEGVIPSAAAPRTGPDSRS